MAINTEKNTYTLVFAVGLVVIVGTLLAAIDASLKDKIRISKNLNLNVKISLKSDNKGSISISFNNIEDYKKIIKKLSSEK